MKNLLTILLCCLCLNANARLTLGEEKDIKAFVISGSVMFGSAMNSCMDAQTDHFSSSIMANWDRNFWDHTNGYSSAHCYNIGSYHVDAWHIEKSLMIMSLCVPVSVVCHENFPIIKKHPVWDMILWEAIGGTAWNLTFNVNYNKILR